MTILVSVAEEERRLISVRTQAALQVAEARGVKLGNPIVPGRSATAQGRVFPRQCRPRLVPMPWVLPLSFCHSRPRPSPRQIAERLNADGIVTVRGATGRPTASGTCWRGWPSHPLAGEALAPENAESPPERASRDRFHSIPKS